MNLWDGLLIIFILWRIAAGFQRGFLGEIFRFAGLFGGAATAFLSWPLLEPFVRKSLGDGPVLKFAVMFFSFLIVIIIFTIIGALLTRLAGKLMLSIPNRILGTVFGAISGVIFALILTFFIMSVSTGSAGRYLYKSFAGKMSIEAAKTLADKLPSAPKPAAPADDGETIWM